VGTPPLVFITGASSGIGQALAARYAAAGWRLALAARRGADMQAWAAAQGLGPGRCAVYGADVAVTDSIVQAAQDCIARQGLPDVVIACVGGGSNAIGIFHPYIEHETVRLIGVEAAGLGLDTGQHAASIQCGSPGVLHGSRSLVLQDDHGQVLETHSISAGLDYPGVGPEHAWLHEIGRAEYVGATDDEALNAFHLLSRVEGIIPALEASHAVAHAVKLAATLPRDQAILVNLSGRGDKDMETVLAQTDATGGQS